jgi:DNA-binding beta-propeller fold protein YncE
VNKSLRAFVGRTSNPSTAALTVAGPFAGRRILNMRVARLGLLAAATLVAAACGGANPSLPEAAAPAAAAAGDTAPASPGPLLCARRHPGLGPARAGEVHQGASVALARLADGTTLAYVADEDENALRTFDVDAQKERASTPLPGSPAQVMVLADGRVAVTLRDQNRVEILEPAAAAADVPLEPRCAIPVAAEPFGLASTPDDARLLVTSAWGKKLTVLDAASLKTSFEIDVAREPRAVVVDDDGQRAFVAHVVGAKMSVVDLASDKHEVRELDLRLSDPSVRSVRKVFGSAGPDKRRGGCQGFALAKSVTAPEASKPLPGERPLSDGKAVPPQKEKAPAVPRARIFAPMVAVDPGDAAVRSGGYGSPVATLGAETPIVSVVDSAAERALTRSLIADGVRHQGECLLPRSAAMSAAGDALYVTCLGTDTLLELDPRGLDPSRLERRRWHMPAGPTGVAVDDHASRAVVWSQFERTLAVVNLNASPDRAPAIAAAAVSGAPRFSFERAMGRRIFHRTDDARISSDGRACASCHPDGREDALTWSTPDGPRQTIMLAGRIASTAPYSWLGAHANLEAHLATTFQRLGGTGLTSVPSRFDEVDALVAYLNGMRGPELKDAPSPPSSRAALVAAGEAIFKAPAQGCVTCHMGGPGTDAATHDVGSGVSADRNAPFDTPSLRFVSGTAPYFHDGRYATLDDLLNGSDGKMGHTLQLSRHNVQALKAYLETL